MLIHSDGRCYINNSVDKFSFPKFRHSLVTAQEFCGTKMSAILKQVRVTIASPRGFGLRRARHHKHSIAKPSGRVQSTAIGAIGASVDLRAYVRGQRIWFQES